MSTDTLTVVEVLKGLRKRAGLSMEVMARLSGYKGASSIQRYENAEQFRKRYLPFDVVERFATALVGRGSPPISQAEVYAMAGPVARGAFPLDPSEPVIDIAPPATSIPSNGRVVEADYIAEATPLSPSQMTKDLPVLGTAAGSAGDGAVQFDGVVIEYVRRPPSLQGVKDSYAIYVVGASMEPRLMEGSLQIVHPNRRPRPGDDVVLQIQRGEADDLQVYVKRLERMTDTAVHCTHYCNLDDDLIFERASVVAIHKVLTTEDLLGF